MTTGAAASEAGRSRTRTRLQCVTMRADLAGNGRIDALVTCARLSHAQPSMPTQHDGLLWFHA
jgi:hypothetical protein